MRLSSGSPLARAWAGDDDDAENIDENIYINHCFPHRWSERV